MFCFHYWRRREPPGALSIALLFREMENDHVVFVSSEHFSLVFIEPISFDTLLPYKRSNEYCRLTARIRSWDWFYNKTNGFFGFKASLLVKPMVFQHC